MTLQSKKYVFPAANTQDVCRLQTVTGASSLSLNGLLVYPGDSLLNFLRYGYSRQLSITSANNLSGVTFTVNGLQNNVLISENITGPNNTTVYSTNVFDVITSITTSATATAVSIGTGYLGFFPLISLNLYITYLNYSFSIATPDNTIDTTVYGTLDNIHQNGIKFATMVANPSTYSLFVERATGHDVMSVVAEKDVIAQLLIPITGTTGTLAQTVTLIFRQCSII